ncbi:type I restriction endonuclease subunit R, EcoR124 family [Peptostreptococcus equinus]|uniref:Type I restriction enzyme R protein C-terminal domain-containing protein n=1 Tax=Peptostreptococcus equinus TaxID=3003601 RepID=A0ABY7JMQ6_9FIRM|nr:hypothetical protein [Peptostreptococcus sp. CBA3647]WAW14375.1 hypothetical protein O0R46_07135 [Peptostreptococcus sp. CBA3647]
MGEFEIELLKTDEINLDYILALILEKSKEHDIIESLVVLLSYDLVEHKHQKYEKLYKK